MDKRTCHERQDLIIAPHEDAHISRGSVSVYADGVVIIMTVHNTHVLMMIDRGSIHQRGLERRRRCLHHAQECLRRVAAVSLMLMQRRP
jgi:hypothetical protein